MKLAQGNIRSLTNEQLFNNIAILKSGIDFENKDTIVNIPHFIETLENELKNNRGFDQQDIDVKVEDLEKFAKNNKKDFWGKTDKIIGTASDVADVFGKFKGFFEKGGTYNDTDDGSDYDIKPKQPDTFNYTPYIIGGVGFFVIVGGLLFFLSKKGSKK